MIYFMSLGWNDCSAFDPDMLQGKIKKSDGYAALDILEFQGWLMPYAFRFSWLRYKDLRFFC